MRVEIGERDGVTRAMKFNLHLHARDEIGVLAPDHRRHHECAFG